MAQHTPEETARIAALQAERATVAAALQAATDGSAPPRRADVAQHFKSKLTLLREQALALIHAETQAVAEGETPLAPVLEAPETLAPMLVLLLGEPDLAQALQRFVGEVPKGVTAEECTDRIRNIDAQLVYLGASA
jgi:hypothetical protein